MKAERGDEQGSPRAPDHIPPKAGAYVLSKLRELDAVIAATAPRIIARADDDDAVHDLRVAIRRLRTLLKMSRRLLGRWHADVVRRAFAEVMRATGELRDEEVLEETLSGAAESPDFAAWLGRRKARETKLRKAVVRRIRQGELDRARLLLKALLLFPVEDKRDLDLARFARRTVERARRKVERKRDVEVTDIDGLHDLRISYKELRYSIELLADALPIDTRAQLEPATVFQKRLGELHDVDVAIDVIQKARGLSDASREQALASLTSLRAKRVAKYLRELDPLGGSRSRPMKDIDTHSPRPGQAPPDTSTPPAVDLALDGPLAAPVPKIPGPRRRRAGTRPRGAGAARK